jgi:hypothetical protein
VAEGKMSEVALTKDDAERVLSLHNQCHLIRPVLLIQLNPQEEDTVPYSKTVFQSAVRSLKSSDIWSFSLLLIDGRAHIAAYVHSKCAGSKWYLSCLDFPLNWTAWKEINKFCPCKTGLSQRWCEHACSLLLLLHLFQDFPDTHPKWLQNFSLSFKSMSASFLQLYGNQFKRDYILDMKEWLFSLSFEKFDKRSLTTSQTFVFLQERPKKTSSAHSKWKTSSVSQAEQQLHLFLREGICAFERSEEVVRREEAFCHEEECIAEYTGEEERMGEEICESVERERCELVESLSLQTSLRSSRKRKRPSYLDSYE